MVVKDWELFRVECEGESLTAFLRPLLVLPLSLPARVLAPSSSLPQPHVWVSQVLNQMHFLHQL